MSSRLSDMDLAARVNSLVERYFGGNVLKAARAWRVPQPTAHRLASGTTRSPRATTLQRIAQYHSTTVEWLLDGKGPSPLEAAPLPMVEYLEFREVVERLGLDPETKWAVLSLPTTIGAAHSVLCNWGVGYVPEYIEEPRRVVSAAQHAAWGAAALQFQSWAHFLEGLIRAYGRERVREKLRSEISRVRLGFHPIGMELLYEDRGRHLLEEILPRVQTGGPWAGTTLIDTPTTPPLNAVPAERLKTGRGRPRRTRPHYRYDEDTDATT